MSYSIENHTRLKPKPEPSFSKKPFCSKDKNRKGNKAETPKPIKELKMKKCKICKTEFMPKNQGHLVCSYECSLKYAEKAQEKKTKEKRVNAHREKKKLLSEDIPHLKKVAQTIFNKFIRLRDGDLPCVSCDYDFKDFTADQPRQAHASHYKPATNSKLRYSELNVHKSCSICNNIFSGNLAEYRIRLIEKIGLEEVEKLESTNGVYKHSAEELLEIIRIYKMKIKKIDASQ